MGHTPHLKGIIQLSEGLIDILFMVLDSLCLDGGMELRAAHFPQAIVVILPGSEQRSLGKSRTVGGTACL